MASIVRELQKDALDKNVSVSDLLRKAFLVAKKLKQNDFIDWLSYEMNGYPQDGSFNAFPQYRVLQGEAQVFNPYHGFQPIIFQNPKHHEVLSKKTCFNSAPELDHILGNGSLEGRYQMNFDVKTEQRLMKAMDVSLKPSLQIQSSSIFKILDSVRNIILNWTLQLEEDGIFGEELSFTAEDQKKATAPIYNITNFFGNVSESQIQQGTSRSMQKFKK